MKLCNSWRIQGLRSTYADYVAVALSDTPFIVWGVYCILFEKAHGHDGSVVELRGKRRYHLAVYQRLNCIKALKAGIEVGKEDLDSCLEALDLEIVPEEEVIELDPDLDCLFDVDTQGDLRRANDILERRSKDDRGELECDV